MLSGETVAVYMIAYARFESDGATTWLRSMWYPWPDVAVETWLVPPSPAAPLWHLRIHRIRSARVLLSAEGGWAIYGQREDDRALEPRNRTHPQFYTSEKVLAFSE